jgi:methionyl-tRNA formyltransferase
VFFGSSAFAVPSLDELAATHDVLEVVTQPDRPAGRGLKLRPTPVCERATRLGLNVTTPERLDAAFAARIAQLRPKLVACVSYGKILPQSLLSLDGAAALNVHPSLLPEYRGAAPIQAALRDGRDATGVTVMWMSARMDAGDVALQRRVPIEPSDDYGSLHDRLAHVGAELLMEAADGLAAGSLARAPQDESKATYTKPIATADLRIDTNANARDIVNLVRAASPKPGAWTLVDGVRVKVLEASGLRSGDADGLVIHAADGDVQLIRIVPEGKREMSGSEFVRWRSHRA